MQLYDERSIDEFTLDQVALRAETTVQTVLRIFDSKEHLLFAALDQLAVRGDSLKPTPPGDIAAAVTAVFDVYEAMGDFVIRQLNDEHRHPALKPIVDRGRDNHRDWVKRAFAPQLAQCSGRARAELFSILDVATDVYVWKLLRRDQPMSRAAAEAIVCRMITGVIDEEHDHGADPVAELVRRRQPAT
jgi:AcrR family transcriptional regulator